MGSLSFLKNTNCRLQLHEILTSSKYKRNMLFGKIKVTCGGLHRGEVKCQAFFSPG